MTELSYDVSRYLRIKGSCRSQSHCTDFGNRQGVSQGEVTLRQSHCTDVRSRITDPLWILGKGGWRHILW